MRLPSPSPRLPLPALSSCVAPARGAAATLSPGRPAPPAGTPKATRSTGTTSSQPPPCRRFTRRSGMPSSSWRPSSSRCRASDHLLQRRNVLSAPGGLTTFPSHTGAADGRRRTLRSAAALRAAIVVHAVRSIGAAGLLGGRKRPAGGVAAWRTCGDAASSLLWDAAVVAGAVAGVTRSKTSLARLLRGLPAPAAGAIL